MLNKCTDNWNEEHFAVHFLLLTLSAMSKSFETEFSEAKRKLKIEKRNIIFGFTPFLQSHSFLRVIYEKQQINFSFFCSTSLLFEVFPFIAFYTRVWLMETLQTWKKCFRLFITISIMVTNGKKLHILFSKQTVKKYKVFFIYSFTFPPVIS